MVEVPQRTPVRGPTFVHVLASLVDADVPVTGPSLPERLSQWLDWTHAIELSTALDGRPPAADRDVPAFGSAEARECARARAALAAAIGGETGAAAMWPLAGVQTVEGAEGRIETVDYTPFRQHCLAMQRAMQATTGKWRGRLRDALAQTSAEMARLAQLDAVMEMALSPREQTLLAAVPTLLEAHFERLRLSGQEERPDVAPDDAAVPAAAAWLPRFRQDMQRVLLAELDVRFQPIDGLLAALREH